MAKNKFVPADSVNPETIALHGGDYRSCLLYTSPSPRD